MRSLARRWRFLSSRVPESAQFEWQIGGHWPFRISVIHHDSDACWQRPPLSLRTPTLHCTWVRSAVEVCFWDLTAKVPSHAGSSCVTSNSQMPSKQLKDEAEKDKETREETGLHSEFHSQKITVRASLQGPHPHFMREKWGPGGRKWFAQTPTFT